MSKHSSDHQLAILKLAREQGITGNIPPATYRLLSLQVRGPVELAKDATRAVVSRTLTGLSLRVVSDEKAAANEATCRKNDCKRFRELRPKKGGSPMPACDACNCAGKWLNSKWKDASESCPLGLWDNQEEKSGS